MGWASSCAWRPLADGRRAPASSSAFAENMGGSLPRSPFASAPGSITFRAPPIACLSLASPRPRPLSGRSPRRKGDGASARAFALLFTELFQLVLQLQFPALQLGEFQIVDAGMLPGLGDFILQGSVFAFDLVEMGSNCHRHLHVYPTSRRVTQLPFLGKARRADRCVIHKGD